MAAAPELAYFAPLFACAVCVALLLAYTSTLGAVLHALEKPFRAVRIPVVGGHPLAFIADGLGVLDKVVQAALGVAIKGTVWSWNHFWTFNAQVVEKIGSLLVGLAAGVAHALDAATGHTVPRLIHAIVRRELAPVEGELARLASKAEAEAASLGGQIAADARAIATVERVALARVAKLEAAIPGEIEHAITKPLDVIHGVEKELERVAKRVGNLTKRLSPAALVALIGATIFNAFDLGWLRCRSVGRIGRKLCGLSGVIEGLFLGAVEGLALTNLCWIVDEGEKAAHTILPVVAGFANELDDLLRCRGISPPPGPALSRSQLPAPWAHLAFGSSGP